MTTIGTSYNVAPNPGEGAFVSNLPIGAITMWGTNVAPSGWLMCDGSAVNRLSFAALFDVIGTIWGVGDGSLTFNLPNTSGKLVRGVNGTYTQASTGGADAVTLAATNLPNHGHTITDPTHNHPAVFQGTGYASVDGGNGNRANFPGTTSAAATGITIADSLLVSGVQQTQVAVTLVNPYIAINHIIKAH